MKSPLLDLIASDRCRFVSATPNSRRDLAAAARIFRECRESYRWTGQEEDPDLLAHAVLSGAAQDGFDPRWTQTFLVRRRSGNALLGLLQLVCASPRPEAVLMSSLFLLAACRRQGFGREVVLHVCERAAKRGYRELVGDFALDNPPAWRCAESLGFCRVSEHVHEGTVMGLRMSKQLLTETRTVLD